MGCLCLCCMHAYVAEVCACTWCTKTRQGWADGLSFNFSRRQPGITNMWQGRQGETICSKPSVLSNSKLPPYREHSGMKVKDKPSNLQTQPDV